jgi:hypothetical protein
MDILLFWMSNLENTYEYSYNQLKNCPLFLQPLLNSLNPQINTQ